LEANSPLAISLASTTLIAAIVGAVASAVGLVFGARVTLKVERSRAAATSTLEAVRALVNYIAACELLAIEFGRLPPATWLDRQAERIPTGRAGWATGRIIERLVVGGRWDDLRDRYHVARAEVMLVSPINVITIVLRMDDLYAEWEEKRTPDLGKKWFDIREELRLTAQSTVDKGLGRPYRAGDPPIGGKTQATKTRRPDQEAPFPRLVKDFRAFRRERRERELVSS
jgi:hypothetical protein